MSERGFEVVDPAARPVVRRETVRVLLLDPDERVLLFRDSDPGTGTSWWITAGGGIDPGESELDAVVRELAEETGHRVDPARVLGPLARRRVLHGYSDQVVEQQDTFYAVRVTDSRVSTDGHTEQERMTLLAHRWWTGHELAGTAETVWPVLLPRLLALLREPDRWPVALPDVEESSVPIG